jgi:hypothetical protein
LIETKAEHVLGLFLFVAENFADSETGGAAGGEIASNYSQQEDDDQPQNSTPCRKDIAGRGLK